MHINAGGDDGEILAEGRKRRREEGTGVRRRGRRERKESYINAAINNIANSY